LDQTVDKTSETPITLAFHQLEQVTSNEVNTQLGKSEKFKILLNNVVRSKNASASDIDYD
jgi:hypothetical protein